MVKGVFLFSGLILIFIWACGPGVVPRDYDLSSNGGGGGGGDSSSSVFNRAVQFDGTNDQINLTHTTNLTLPAIYTLEAWVRFTTGGAVRRIYMGSKMHTLGINAANNIFGMWPTTNCTGTTQQSNGNTALTAGTKYHLAFSIDVNEDLRMFVNGVQDAATSKQNPIACNSISSSTIGINITGGTSPWIGVIDEIRVSNVARYTSDFTPPSQPFTSDGSTVFLYHHDGPSLTGNVEVPTDTSYSLDNGAFFVTSPFP